MLFALVEVLSTEMPILKVLVSVILLTKIYIQGQNLAQ